MALLQIIYTSTATVSLDDRALREMVAGASRRNRRLGVTGMLYCADGAYLQILEGEEAAVIPLYADILHDDRHDDIRTVAIRPIPSRDFANWAMALVNRMPEPVDLEHVLNRHGDRIGIWNHAGWQAIVNTFRAELETVEP